MVPGSPTRVQPLLEQLHVERTKCNVEDVYVYARAMCMWCVGTAACGRKKCNMHMEDMVVRGVPKYMYHCTLNVL